MSLLTQRKRERVCHCRPLVPHFSYPLLLPESIQNVKIEYSADVTGEINHRRIDGQNKNRNALSLTARPSIKNGSAIVKEINLTKVTNYGHCVMTTNGFVVFELAFFPSNFSQFFFSPIFASFLRYIRMTIRPK